jgi:hypothetical protein
MSTSPLSLYLTTTGRKSGLPREIEIWLLVPVRNGAVSAGAPEPIISPS